MLISTVSTVVAQAVVLSACDCPKWQTSSLVHLQSGTATVLVGTTVLERSELLKRNTSVEGFGEGRREEGAQEGGDVR